MDSMNTQSCSSNISPKQDTKHNLMKIRNLDPKTMEFRNLVELIHPGFIKEILGKIFIFLRSRTKEISFSNLTTFKKAFIARLAENHEDLKCAGFDQACRTMASHILQELKTNENIYKWQHYYEAQGTKNVLVFKKIYLPVHSNSRRSSGTSVQSLPQKASDLPNVSAQDPDDSMSQCSSSSDKFLKALNVDIDSFETNGTNSTEIGKSDKSKIDNWSNFKNIKQKRGIHWQPATEEKDSGSLPSFNVHQNTERRRLKLSKGNTKLLNAMLVPVEIDKATRMMRLMGWNGGALGKHGEGIIEPILPNISDITGAGLGHVRVEKKKAVGKGKDKAAKVGKNPIRERKKKNTKQDRKCFRMFLLDRLLEFLKDGDTNETTLQLEDKIEVRDRRMLSNIMNNLNKRKKDIGLNTEEELFFVKDILEFFNKDKNMEVLHDISYDFKRLTLTKEWSDKKVYKIKRKQNDAKNVGKSKNIIKAEDMTIQQVYVNTKDYEKVVKELLKEFPGRTRSELKVPALKVQVLRVLQGFLKNKKVMHLELYHTLKSNMVETFLNLVTDCLNSRRKLDMKKRNLYSLGDVKELYEEMLNIVDCYLKMFIDSNRNCFVFMKIYYKNKFINSAKPQTATTDKMKDEDKTIGGITKTKDGVVVINDSDSDIINMEEDSCTGKEEDKEEAKETEDLVVIESDNENEEATENDSDIVKNETLEANELVDAPVKCFIKEINENKPKSVLEALMERNYDELMRPDDILIVKSENLVVDDATYEREWYCKPNAWASPVALCNEHVPEKRLRNDSDKVVPVSAKRTKLENGEISYRLAIVFNEDADVHMEMYHAAEIQKVILDEITLSGQLPKLKCVGLRSNGLVYKSFDFMSYKWLEGVVKKTKIQGFSLKLRDFIIEDVIKRKVLMKIVSFIDEEPEMVFRRLELYNPDVETDGWVVIDKFRTNDLVFLVLEMDEHSLGVISVRNFSVDIGTDRAFFTFF